MRATTILITLILAACGVDRPDEIPDPAEPTCSLSWSQRGGVVRFTVRASGDGLTLGYQVDADGRVAALANVRVAGDLEIDGKVEIPGGSHAEVTATLVAEGGTIVPCDAP